MLRLETALVVEKPFTRGGSVVADGCRSARRRRGGLGLGITAGGSGAVLIRVLHEAISAFIRIEVSVGNV